MAPASHGSHDIALDLSAAAAPPSPPTSPPPIRREAILPSATQEGELIRLRGFVCREPDFTWFSRIDGLKFLSWRSEQFNEFEFGARFSIDGFKIKIGPEARSILVRVIFSPHRPLRVCAL
jgi:hypothetical protein